MLTYLYGIVLLRGKSSCLLLHYRSQGLLCIFSFMVPYCHGIGRLHKLSQVDISEWEADSSVSAMGADVRVGVHTVQQRNLFLLHQLPIPSATILTPTHFKVWYSHFPNKSVSS